MPGKIYRQSIVIIAALLVPILPFVIIGELPGERWLSSADENAWLFGLTGSGLLMLDIALPDMSGLAVCEQLRANPNTADLPVIMLSVLIDVQDRIRGFKAGADEYLSKPVDSDELIASVSAIVERARQRAKM